MGLEEVQWRLDGIPTMIRTGRGRNADQPSVHRPRAVVLLHPSQEVSRTLGPFRNRALQKASLAWWIAFLILAVTTPNGRSSDLVEDAILDKGQHEGLRVAPSPPGKGPGCQVFL